MKKRSSYLDNAAKRLKNKKWLGYSAQIAARIHAQIEENEDLNQKKLADTLAVSQQHISKILKGQENLTLETIAKLSDALNVELISFPVYKDNYIFLLPSKNKHETNTVNSKLLQNLAETNVKASTQKIHLAMVG